MEPTWEVEVGVASGGRQRRKSRQEGARGWENPGKRVVEGPIVPNMVGGDKGKQQRRSTSNGTEAAIPNKNKRGATRIKK